MSSCSSANYEEQNPFDSGWVTFLGYHAKLSGYLGHMKWQIRYYMCYGVEKTSFFVRMNLVFNIIGILTNWTPMLAKMLVATSSMCDFGNIFP